MTESTPPVSVIIPTYNRSHFVSQAIESVLKQTFRDFEIIVVDDGSSDDTATVCAEYPEKVRYIYQKNQGRAEARNTGMRESRSKYLAFLDDDDIFLPDHLQLQVDYLETNPDVGMVYGTYVRVDENLIPYEERPPKAPTSYPEMLRMGVEMQTSTVMMRRELIDVAGYLDTRFEIMEEIDYFITIAKHTKIGSIREPLVHMRQHPGNSERGLHPKVFQHTLFLLDKHLTPPSDLSWRRRNQIYGSVFNWWTFLWLSAGEDGQKMIDRYKGRIWRYLPWYQRKKLLFMRLLFRTVVPDPIKNHLRSLWRKS